MRVVLGDIVSSEFRTGPIKAMSRQWCIHEDEDGEEYALEWGDVWIPIHSDYPASSVKEMEVKRDHNRS